MSKTFAVSDKIKNQFDDIFIILTYKNTQDIIELLKSLRENVDNYKVVIVNSFFDLQTKAKIHEIAQEYNCDFIPVENKGYGYGNNVGIDFAIQNYVFKRIVISNPDVTLDYYDQQELDKINDGIIGGIIINPRGKNQNPLRVFDCNFTNYSPYYLYVKNNKLLFYMSLIIAKFQRIKMFFSRKITRVFAVHGSFFVINKHVVDKFPVLFDEKIFLFEEEIDIGKNLKKNNVPIYYSNCIKVHHKEDGDLKKSSLNIIELMYESCKYVMNKWEHR